ncbi:hypothetical protein [Amycolatopsis sp. CA-128772]|uniref:hypothetical protein n=1 Tax=Amycolatopsis sp. CA-128772 TaxID=2073159 RepID=UPI0011B00A49|nr:hypothetical protein [Amycolatopsis sp. CA-128772]
MKARPRPARRTTRAVALLNKLAVWEGWVRLASLAAVVTLWFTADNAITSQQQAQTNQWQAQLAARSQQESVLTTAYGQLSSGNAATRAAVIRKFRQLGAQIPEEQHHIDGLIRDYLWESLPPNRCTPGDEIPADLKAAFESTYDEFKITHFNDGDSGAILTCMKKTSADTLEINWHQRTPKDLPAYDEDYSATLHIDKNLFGLEETTAFLSCNCHELNMFTKRQRHVGVDLAKAGSDAREPYQVKIAF